MIDFGEKKRIRPGVRKRAERTLAKRERSPRAVRLSKEFFESRWASAGDYSSHRSRGQSEKQRMVVTVPFVGFAQRAKLKTFVFKNKWGHDGDYPSPSCRPVST
ncbi:hypothetical protein HMPREF0262_03257 [Clostridium sp. ATCC 29733]|nr:hypothetical protein HMPREF0262_03257 [Clostridium sp. ATCC 29733]